MKNDLILLHYIIVNENKKTYYASLDQVRASLVLRAKKRRLPSWRNVLETDTVIRCYGRLRRNRVERLYDRVTVRALCSTGI